MTDLLHQIKNIRGVVFLIASLLIFTVLWLSFPHMLSESDPWGYSVNAFKLLDGQGFPNFYSPYSYRIGIYLPVALFYALFGINLYTTHAPSLCAALSIIVLVWIALPDKRSKLIGLFLCLTSLPLFVGSTDLYPDFFASALMAWCVALLVYRRTSCLDPRLFWLFPALSVFLAFAAFLAKETAYWVSLIWLIVFAMDRKASDFRSLLRRFYLPAVISGTIIALTYLVFCQIFWGDYLVRLHNLEYATNAHIAFKPNWVLSATNGRELVARLTFKAAHLVFAEFGLVFALAAASFVILPKQLKLWWLYAATTVALFWFGSTSLTHYNPLPLFPRYLLPALPGLLITAAYAISQLAMHTENGTIAVNRAIPLAALLVFLGFQYAGDLRTTQLAVNNSKAAAVKIVRADVFAHPDTKFLLVTSDLRSAKSSAFYFGYRYPKNLLAVPADHLASSDIAADKIYVAIDTDDSTWLKDAYSELNYDLEIRTLGLPVIFAANSVTLYGVPNKEKIVKLLEIVNQKHREVPKDARDATEFADELNTVGRVANAR